MDEERSDEEPAAVTAEAEVASAVAEAAGDLLLRHFRTGVAAEWKGRQDLVTVADRDAEELIRRHIAEAFGDMVVGEEGDELPEAAVRGRRRWYVDPLDGTTNFVKGQPRWAVAVAFVDETDRLAAAAVRVPLAGESFAATRGCGATLDGRATAAAVDVGPEGALAFLGPLTGLQPAVPAIARRVLSVRVTGSTVCDLVDLACGRGDLYLGTRQGRWDLAAGTLIAAEAGAVVTDLSGVPLTGPGDAAFAAVPAVHAALGTAILSDDASVS